MKTNANASAVVVPAPEPAGTNDLAGADIRDIRSPVEIPSGWEWLGWLLAGVAVAAVAWLLWRWWRCRAAARAVAPWVSPEQRAHQALEQAWRWLPEPKLFCTAVSDALRAYLEARCGLRAPERTTEEFLGDLQQGGRLNEVQRDTLADFLARCDLVKFARHSPPESELRQLHGVAERLVDELAPAAAPPAAQGGTT